ncbi:MAG TPA: septal ring lytic transglycosylase RlpA family protein [bacterium]|nr:septal ring lytic transglycosylase RlpA family protein [bacterium]
MSRLRLLRFLSRTLPPGLAWIALALSAGCSTSGKALVPPHPAAAAAVPPAQSVKGADAASNPLPMDSYASAVVPRWLVDQAPLKRPAFTPHWYTPAVDPLFRHHLPPAAQEPSLATGGGAGADIDTDAEPATAQREPVEPSPRVALRAPRPGNPGIKDYSAVAPLLEGIASWYGPGFHGKPTASGETYNQHELTAAHPTLPLGTIIRVQNEQNGRVVWVRVNDRGPYKKGRVLDLSRAAAERLGMVQEGTAPVRISVLRWPRNTDTELGLRAYSQYVVQVAAYPEPDKAEGLLERMQRRFHWAAFILDPRPGGALAVVTGPYNDNAAAQGVARRLREAGVTSLVRRYRK